MARKKRKIKRRSASLGGPVPGLRDFSSRFGPAELVQGRRVSGGVCLDIRKFQPGMRDAVILCFGGTVPQLAKWLKEHEAKLNAVVEELAR